ncbi:MAG: beta-L-arabinofuranosidase domain-containing protein [Phycisphaerales bacterium]
MRNGIRIVVIAGLLALAGFAGIDVAAAASPDLAVPPVHMTLEGPMGARLDGIIHNWLIPAPDANPGMLEMMRLRDRKPPYEDPVPWAGEFAGKYLTSCVRACRMSSDPELRAVTARVMKELIATQAQDGYLGPFPDKHLMDRWDLWGHYHCMLAMVLWSRDMGDAEALQAATRAADLMCATFLDTGKRVYDAGSYEMNMAVIHVLGMLYRQTKNDAYLRLMRQIEQDWQKPGAGDYHRLAMQGVEFYQTPKPRWESLHPMAGLAGLFRVTGEDSYRQALVHWWRSIYRTDVHNSGSFSTNEQAVGNPFQSGAIETCCTVAWLALSVETLRLTGDSRIADALEHATWNAVLGYEHPSGRWCTYDTPMNGKRLASAHSIVFQSRPGTPELNCCSVNGANGLGLLSEWAVLGGTSGLYLNYYGPGTVEATLEDGSSWSFTQVTAYPAAGRIDLEIHPAKRAALPLFLRIPEWSQNTKAAVNGVPIEKVAPGSYLQIERAWSPGDRITIDFDLSVRALRGDEHVQFNTSLLRGPILLAFDQKHNTMDPGDMPELDLASLRLEPLAADDAVMQDKTLGPIAAFATQATDGRRVVLCDFGSAGAYGTYYRSWLPVRNAPPSPFHLVQPEQGARLPAGDVQLIWTRGEPGSEYEVMVWDERAGRDSAHRQSGLTETEFQPTWQLAPGNTYCWQVIARQGQQIAPSTNGPWSFIVDPAVPSMLHGVVLRAALAGKADPQEGSLLLAQKVESTAGPGGQPDTALHFNGRDSKLVYAAPRFPLRTYTLAAWMKPEGLGPDGNKWHHVFSAWRANVNDALRVSIQDGKLVVNIEQPGGGCHIAGGPVENGKWVHVAVVKKYRDLALYVNGRRIATTSVANTLVSGPVNAGVGCNPNFSDTESFQGCIADVLFSRDAMTDAQIAAMAVR